MKKLGAIFGAAWLGISLHMCTGLSFTDWKYHVITLPTLAGFWLYLKQK